MEVTDARREGLLKGLRQLTSDQLYDVLDYEGELCLDDYNYADGKWCPLAVGVGLHKWVKEPTHDKVYCILTMGGFSVYNTRGLKGDYYTTDRHTDLCEAVWDVLEERGVYRLPD